MPKKTDNDKPKRPKSAYLCYCDDYRPEIMKVNTMAQASKILGEQWKNLTPEEQQQYKDTASDLKDKYIEKMKNWKPPAKNDDDDEEEKPSKGKGKGKTTEKTKRGKTGYMLFGADERKRLKKDQPDTKPTEIMKLIGAAWKELSDSKRDDYNKKAKK